MGEHSKDPESTLRLTSSSILNWYLNRMQTVPLRDYTRRFGFSQQLWEDICRYLYIYCLCVNLYKLNRMPKFPSLILSPSTHLYAKSLKSTNDDGLASSAYHGKPIYQSKCNGPAHHIHTLTTHIPPTTVVRTARSALIVCALCDSYRFVRSGWLTQHKIDHNRS